MLLETIRCESGKALHLSYHQQRLDHSLHTLGITSDYDLNVLLSPPAEGIFRCRFLYDAQRYQIEYLPYTPRTIQALRLIHVDGSFSYPLKYADRSDLDALYRQRGECDDVLIVQEGFLKDTTIANIALDFGEGWMTPEAPLLAGTTRARLIDEGVLRTAPIRIEELPNVRRIALMNAMMGFIELEDGIIV